MLPGPTTNIQKHKKPASDNSKQQHGEQNRVQQTQTKTNHPEQYLGIVLYLVKFHVAIHLVGDGVFID